MIVRRPELTLNLPRNPANAGKMWMGRELQEQVFQIGCREDDLWHTPELIAQTECRHEGFSKGFFWYNLNHGTWTDVLGCGSPAAALTARFRAVHAVH